MEVVGQPLVDGLVGQAGGGEVGAVRHEAKAAVSNWHVKSWTGESPRRRAETAAGGSKYLQCPIRVVDEYIV